MAAAAAPTSLLPLKPALRCVGRGRLLRLLHVFLR